MSAEKQEPAQKNFTEFEVRSSRVDSRRYHCGRFPKRGNAPETAAAPQPDFKREFTPPVYMRYEELKKEMTEEELQEEAARKAAAQNNRRGGFKRIYYKPRKEFRWCMEDASRKKVYHGKEEGGQTARYFVMIPPQVDGGGEHVFRVVPVEKWFNFKKPPIFTAMSTEQAEAILDNKFIAGSRKLERLMKANQNKDVAEGEQTWVMDKGQLLGETKKDEGEDGYRESFTSTVKKLGNLARAAGASTSAREEALDEPSTPVDNEEDVAELAIDRVGKADEDGFADFDDKFEDDEDDQAEFVADDMQENAESLETGAEGFREASEEFNEDDDEEGMEEMDGNDKQGGVDGIVDNNRLAQLERREQEGEDDEDEETNTLDLYNKLSTSNFLKQGGASKDSAGASDAARNVEEKTADTTEGGAATADGSKAQKRPNPNVPVAATAKVAGAQASSSSAAGEPRAKKLKQDAKSMFEENVVAVIRENQGKITTKELVKRMKKRMKQHGFVMSKGADTMKQLQAAIQQVAKTEEDVVHGVVLVLKQQYL